MFERALPPLLKADLPPTAEAWMRDLELAGWNALWELGEHGPQARIRAYPVGKLVLFKGAVPTGVSVPIVAYVLRAGDLTLAVDTGLGARWRDAPPGEAPDEGPSPGLRYHPVLDGPTFAELLAAEGVAVDTTVCTHLHLDHVGGARELGATVRASVDEVATALSGDARGYPPEDLRGLPLTPTPLDGGAVGSFPAHAILAPGVMALSTPGHTPGSISIFACIGRAWALVCGDAAYPRAEEPGSPAYLGMLRIRRALDELGSGALVLAGHDTAVLRACAGGAWLGT